MRINNNIISDNKVKITIILLSIFFVLMSFIPTFYDLYEAKNLPKERTHVLEHNYMFDYNFYLSRIRQGQEGRWTVSEKYYNQLHTPSLFQIVYLYLGKIGLLFSLTSTAVYHLSRFIFGVLLLWAIYYYAKQFIEGIWLTAAFLLTVTASSWPILVFVNGFPRFATYMGWWSVVDSLQRITFIPHILIGQLMMVLILWRYTKHNYSSSESDVTSDESRSSRPIRQAQGRQARTINQFVNKLPLLFWVILGFVTGIIFPPALIIVYMVFMVMSAFEVLDILAIRINVRQKKLIFVNWIKTNILPKIIFVVFSFPSLLYINLMFKVLPWSALAVFDIEHRIPLPYKDWALALGPVLPLGFAGMILSFIKNNRKMYPVLSWILVIGILCIIFENVPQQSPLRWTEGMVHVPLAVLTVYFLQQVWQYAGRFKNSFKNFLRWGIVGVYIIILLLGLGVMISMVGWLSDQVVAKAGGTWSVPIGAQLGYPLKEFMDAVYFFRDKTDRKSVVLTYITAGNFIPAYAGNYVYIGHANTPDEDGKEPTAARFFAGKMAQEEAKQFLKRERIDYIFFGPQERELGNIADLKTVYPVMEEVYRNSRVVVYKIK